MDWTIPLVSLTGGILFGAMSPGPSFIVVARAAISQSRLDGLATAFGHGGFRSSVRQCWRSWTGRSFGQRPHFIPVPQNHGSRLPLFSGLYHVELGTQTTDHLEIHPA